MDFSCTAQLLGQGVLKLWLSVLASGIRNMAWSKLKYFTLQRGKPEIAFRLACLLLRLFVLSFQQAS